MRTFAAGFSDELVKLAYCSPSPMGMDQEEQWSSRFKGTPLYEQALQLEEAEIQSTIEMDAQRLQEDQERMAKGDIWQRQQLQRDQFRLQKKQMELQLTRVKHQVEAQANASGFQDLDTVGAKPAVQPGPPKPVAQPQPQQGQQPQQAQPQPQQGQQPRQ